MTPTPAPHPTEKVVRRSKRANRWYVSVAGVVCALSLGGALLRAGLARSGAPAVASAYETSLVVEDLAVGGKATLESIADGLPLAIVGWSPLCPCVKDCNAQIQELIADADFAGLRWIGLSAEPGYTRQDARNRVFYDHSPYPIFHDQEGQVCRALGIDRATVIVLLDGRGRPMFRGTFDSGTVSPTQHEVARAALDVLAGRVPRVRSFDSGIGCTFSWAQRHTTSE